MVKHSFKIGDKVKLKGFYCGISGNDIGEVIDVSNYIEVSWVGYLGVRLGKRYPHKISEIEHAVEIGKQLLFDFMKGD